MASQVEQSTYVDVEGIVREQATIEVRYGND
jgi:hypothetical protein